MRQRLYLAPLLALLLGACSRATYIPTQVVTPLLRAKNDMKISLSPDAAQFAYAITDRWAVTLNGHLSSRWIQDRISGLNDRSVLFLYDGYFGPLADFNTNTRGGQVEVGAGYAIPYGHPSKPHKRLEFFGGYSFGMFRTLDSNFLTHPLIPLRRSDFWISNRLHRVFVQTSLANSFPRSEFVFTTRLSMLYFHDMYSNGWSWHSRPANRARFHDLEGKVFPVFEPALTHTMGGRRVQFYYQLRAAFSPLYGIGNEDHTKKGPPEIIQPISISFGVIYRQGKWFGRKSGQKASDL